MDSQLAAALVASGLVSLCLTGLARHYALKQGLIDHPDARRPHELPTPRGGGIGLVATFFLFLPR